MERGVARDEDTKERCMEAYKEEKRKIQKCLYERKKKVNEQFGWKMNQNVNRNRKLFWKEVSKANGKNVENCTRIKGANGRLTLEEDEV